MELINIEKELKNFGCDTFRFDKIGEVSFHQYFGDVIIYDSNKHCSVFEYRFICSEEKDVIKVLDTLRHFGTYIDENTRKLNLKIDSAAKQGYYRRG